MRDLEIRGSATLLGNKQSGHMLSVGFDLYCKLLSQALSADFESEFDILWSVDSLKQQAFIPDDYIPNSKERLAIYTHLAQLTSIKDLDRVKDDLSDRYGEIPFSVGLFLKGIQKQLAS